MFFELVSFSFAVALVYGNEYKLSQKKIKIEPVLKILH